MKAEADKYWEKVFLNGDLKAFEWLYKNTFQQLCFYAFQITGDQFLAEETVQETLIKVWNDRKQVHITGSIKSYLYKAVHNQAINKLIQQKTLKYSVNNTVTGKIWDMITENYAYHAFLIEKIEAEDTENKINKAVNELPDQCREIFCLSRFENESNTEIAEKLNISVNTVRTQLYRALEKIKDALEK